MHCYHVPGAIVCGNRQKCRDCGGVSRFLCDHPVGDGKTCDRPMCGEHATEVGPDRHYCLIHRLMVHAVRGRTPDLFA